MGNKQIIKVISLNSGIVLFRSDCMEPHEVKAVASRIRAGMFFDLFGVKGERAVFHPDSHSKILIEIEDAL